MAVGVRAAMTFIVAALTPAGVAATAEVAGDSPGMDIHVIYGREPPAPANHEPVLLPLSYGKDHAKGYRSYQNFERRCFAFVYKLVAEVGNLTETDVNAWSAHVSAHCAESRKDICKEFAVDLYAAVMNKVLHVRPVGTGATTYHQWCSRIYVTERDHLKHLSGFWRPDSSGKNASEALKAITAASAASVQHATAAKAAEAAARAQAKHAVQHTTPTTTVAPATPATTVAPAKASQPAKVATPAAPTATNSANVVNSTAGAAVDKETAVANAKVAVAPAKSAAPTAPTAPPAAKANATINDAVKVDAAQDIDRASDADDAKKTQALRGAPATPAAPEKATATPPGAPPVKATSDEGTKKKSEANSDMMDIDAIIAKHRRLNKQHRAAIRSADASSDFLHGLTSSVTDAMDAASAEANTRGSRSSGKKQAGNEVRAAHREASKKASDAIARAEAALEGKGHGRKASGKSAASNEDPAAMEKKLQEMYKATQAEAMNSDDPEALQKMAEKMAALAR